MIEQEHLTIMIEKGKRLLSALQKQKIELNGFLWYYFSDQDSYKLLIATNKKSPRDFYKTIREINKAIPIKYRIDLDDIKYTKFSDVKDILENIQIDKEIVHFEGNILNRYVESAFIYKI